MAIEYNPFDNDWFLEKTCRKVLVGKYIIYLSIQEDDGVGKLISFWIYVDDHDTILFD